MLYEPNSVRIQAAPARRRDKLLDAALTLFAEKGYHGVAVPIIAKTAGISIGAVYTYFASKDELVNELFWIWKQELKSIVLTAYPAEATVQEQFYFIWDRLHFFADTHPQAFQFLESHLHVPYLSEKCQKLETEVFEIGWTFVRRGQESDKIRDADPKVIVSFFFGAFVQFFKDSRAKRLSWNMVNSLVVRDFCWDAMKKSKPL